MNQQIRQYIQRLEQTLQGEPWYGKSMYKLLGEVPEEIAFVQPGGRSHSAVEILYHMLTWAEFTLNRVQKKPIDDLDAFEQLDWRVIEPAQHGWEEGMAALTATHQELIATLETADDSLLDEKVDYREYDFRTLLEGLLTHNIYHVGQIAVVHKLLS